MSEQLEQRREALREKEGEYVGAKKFMDAFDATAMIYDLVATLSMYGGDEPHVAVYVVGRMQGQLQRFLDAKAVLERYEREKQLLTDMERLENAINDLPGSK